ncbi:MAG: hypothetical protein KGZ69_12770 [Methylomonas sp.]|nr:hypothetical protein [Methylomonas sp.]
MTILQFTIQPIDAHTRAAPALPVNVHRARDFAIVSRSVTGRDLSLEPGDYIAVVRFPDGAEVSQPFSLDPKTDVVQLQDAAHMMATHFESNVIGEPAWTSRLPYEFVDFNPFANEIVTLKEDRTFAIRKEVAGPNSDRWRYLPVAPRGGGIEHVEKGRGTFLVAIPTPERARVTITLNIDKRGRPCPSFIMPRSAATLLYSYLTEGASEAATRLSGSIELSAMELVANKAEDPISGALGLYLLLGAGQSGEVGQRSEKLFEYNPRLADGAIIWAEYLALKGRHSEAAEALTSLKTRGLPTLTIGFRMALSRISTYIKAELMVTSLGEIERTLRYWARRASQKSPTTVIELDGEWSSRLGKALAGER